MTSVPNMLLAINYVDYADENKRNLQDIALSVLEKNRPSNVNVVSINYPEDVVSVPLSWKVLKELKGDSKKDLGNRRNMPYVKEIFDICARFECDIFGYMNSDILLTKEFFSLFNDEDAYIFYKKDISKLGSNDFINGRINIVDNKPFGVDAVFFNRSWWIKNHSLFPKLLILGESEWDTCYNSIIQAKVGNYCLKRELYHVYHDRIWDISSRGAIHNKLIWDNVREKYGLPKYTPETREQ